MNKTKLLLIFTPLNIKIERILIMHICVLFTSFSMMSQDHKNIFAEEIFYCVRNSDSIKLMNYIANEDTLLEYIGSSTLSNSKKQEFIQDLNENYTDFSTKLIFDNLKKINKKGKSFGINWNKTEYHSSTIKQVYEDNLLMNSIEIKFSYYSTFYYIHTSYINSKSKNYIITRIRLEKDN